MLVPFFVYALWSRSQPKAMDVGIGPQPIINNIYHKKALALMGYKAETYVFKTNFITSDFDFDISKYQPQAFPMPPVWRYLALFVRALNRYRALIFYFNGGSLYPTKILRYLEPLYYKLAGIKIIAIPYGSDVQDMRLSPNLAFKQAMSQDYPLHFKAYDKIQANIRRWTQTADWVISGMEWVDYMGHWDSLVSNHFALDLAQWSPQTQLKSSSGPLKVLHAPNHRHIKGTPALEGAIRKLQDEGLPIELIILEKVPNHQIQAVMQTVDIVAEQFIVGWYSMFAMEGMALEKPVMTYLRPDLLALYTNHGIIDPNVIPILNTPIDQIESMLRWALKNRDQLGDIGKQGRAYVERYHSLEAIGRLFASILTQLDLPPTQLLPPSLPTPTPPTSKELSPI